MSKQKPQTNRVASLWQSTQIFIKNLCQLAQLEAKLAVYSFILIVGLICLCVLLIACIWGIAMAAMVVGLHYAGLNWPIALIIPALLNLTLLLISIYLLSSNVKNLWFVRTVRQLSDMAESPSI